MTTKYQMSKILPYFLSIFQLFAWDARIRKTTVENRVKVEYRIPFKQSMFSFIAFTSKLPASNLSDRRGGGGEISSHLLLLYNNVAILPPLQGMLH